MADLDYGAFGAPRAAVQGQVSQTTMQHVPVQAGAMARVANFIGAASSIALVVGLGVWGYQLAVRDVSNVPVIRALEGPARVQPEDPGGQLAQHQGLSVNSVQSEGSAAGPAPRVILAPDPIDLTDADKLPAGKDGAQKAAGDATAQAGTQAPVLKRSASELTAPNSGGVQDGGLAGTELDAPQSDVQASLARARAFAQKLEDSHNAAQSTPADGDGLSADLDPETAVADGDLDGENAERARAILDPAMPGVNRSPVPGRKPKASAIKVAAKVPAATDDGAIEAAIASAMGALEGTRSTGEVPAGTRLVQLGAFDDQATAKAEWDMLAGKFADYMDGKSQLIQEAERGGRVFYRLRAMGFDDLNASRRFCAVLVAENVECIPVTAR